IVAAVVDLQLPVEPEIAATVIAEPAAAKPARVALPDAEAVAHEASAPAAGELDAHDIMFAHDPLFPNAESEWRTWLHDLEAARGPKPLAVVERMFVTSYVPLCDALAR